MLLAVKLGLFDGDDVTSLEFANLYLITVSEILRVLLAVKFFLFDSNDSIS